LITYYDMQFSLSHRQEFEEKREQHALWLIAHHPDSDGAASPGAWLDPHQPRYAEARALWLQQAKAQSGNTSVLANAASALQFEPELSRELASRALAIKPRDRRLLELIAWSYMREMRGANSAEQRKSSARSALQALEVAAEVEPDAPGAGDLLQDLAVSAFESGDWKKAKTYANTLVAPQKPGVGPNGDAIHIGNTLLGSLALRDGDIEEAKRRLIASAPEEGSPILDSYGPRMSLAAALLDRGERSTVVAYLDKCEHFWRLGLDKIPQWEAEIRAGKTPDFGENLRW
jgi:hypothetical protein